MMGSCCCCFSRTESITSKTPLLKNASSVIYNNTADVAITNAETHPVKSNRKRRSGFPEWAKTHQQSKPTELKPKPVQVVSVDRKIEEIFTLFNNHLKKWQYLKSCVTKLSTISNKDEENLPDTFNFIKRNYQNLHLNLQRKSKFYMEITLSDSSVPNDLMEVIELFNETNKLIKEIIDNYPLVTSTINTMIEEEKSLRRHVLMASLGAEGPTCMKNCIDNISDMKRSVSYIDIIEKETTQIFESLKSAASCLFENE